MSNGFQKFISGKGFYLALAVCLAGAGAAAWVAVDKTIENIETTPLSETPQVQQQADSAPAEQKLDNIAQDDSLSLQKEEPEDSTSAAADGDSAPADQSMKQQINADAGEQDETRKVCRLGKGVAVSFMDKASIAQPELFAELLRLAEGSGIAHQVKMAVAGGNDSGPIQRTGCGAKVCVLSVPCRYIHSPSTVLCLEDVEAQYLLAKAYLTR